MPSRQQKIDEIVRRERAAGKSRAAALAVAMEQVDSGSPSTSGNKSTTPIYDAAVARAKKKGTKIPTAVN